MSSIDLVVMAPAHAHPCPATMPHPPHQAAILSRPQPAYDFQSRETRGVLQASGPRPCRFLQIRPYPCQGPWQDSGSRGGSRRCSRVGRLPLVFDPQEHLAPGVAALQILMGLPTARCARAVANNAMSRCAGASPAAAALVSCVGCGMPQSAHCLPAHATQYCSP